MKPTDILRFFNTLNAKKDSLHNIMRPYAIFDFIKKLHDEGVKNVSMEQIYAICKKFEAEGLLVSAGTNGNGPLVNQCFYNMTLDKKLADYGAYDFLINGFLDIRNKFSSTVLPIVVQHKENGKMDIGTTFAISDNTLLTAKHCVENMDWIKVLKDSEVIKLRHIFLPKNEKIDLAVIETEENVFEGVSKLRFGTGNVLDEILTLGYPPIAGFDAVQFSERGTISTKYKASLGDIAGKGNSYLDGVDYFLINARVKGGNSGGPVINKLGCTVGMLTQLPYDIENPDRVDLMGFGVVMPTEIILENLNGEKLDGLDGKNSEDGFKINMP